MSLFGDLPPIEPRPGEEQQQTTQEQNQQQPSQTSNIPQGNSSKAWVRPEFVPNLRRPKIAAKHNIVSSNTATTSKHPHSHPDDPASLISKWNAVSTAKETPLGQATTSNESGAARQKPSDTSQVILRSLSEYMPAAARPLARKDKPVFEPFEEYNAAAPNNYQTYKTWLQHHKRERRLDRKRQIPVGEPSMCIVLTNMADDIDDGLEAETEEECSAFGRVVHCVATTVDNPGSPFEGVLIYVQFADLDSAARARDALDQRYFDGRHISATFVPLIPSRTAAPS